VGHAWHEPQHANNAAGNRERLRAVQYLARELLAHVLIAADAAHDQARRGRNDESGYLRHKAVPDRQQRVGLRRARDRHRMLDNSDDEAAHQADHQDEYSRDRIAPHELARAVHRAVKVCFLRNLGAAAACFVFADEASV
jgi:hypothetical protein